MLISEAEWLSGKVAEAVLGELREVPATTPSLVAGLRKRFTAAQAGLLVEQAELRRHARRKFTLADQMLFTRKAYEQSTDEVVARYKATRFAGHERVIDACCGIGGDLIGLAGCVERVFGFDADPVIAAFAHHNVRSHGIAAEVRAVELAAGALPDCDAWHADPDRRPGKHRTTSPEAHLPPLGTLTSWREQTGSGAVKFAPATHMPAVWQAESELEWISHRGECRQMVAWTGALAGGSGVRRATRLARNQPPATFIGGPGVEPPVARELGPWLHEPDPAVLAADLTGALAEQLGLAAIAPPLPYLTSDQPAGDPLLASFEVIEAMPLDRKRLEAWLAERRIGRLEIKCRGVRVTPEKLRRDLRPRGDASATLIVFPQREGAARRASVQVVVARRPVTA